VSLGKEVYEHYTPAGKGVGLLPLVYGNRVLEIGFGSGALLNALAARGNEVYGIDAGHDIVENAQGQGFSNVFHLDVSEETLPFETDFFQAVYCYEVFEHLTNPHRMFSEVRRVLKRGGPLFFSVPAQEMDMGYGFQRHTFVYPGLMQRENLERFFMQMYFRIERYIGPGPTDWLLGHNYVLINMKSEGKPDVVDVITKDVSIPELYGDVLSEEELKREVKRELADFALLLAYTAQNERNDIFAGLLSFVLQNYPREYSFYLALAERLYLFSGAQPAKELIAALVQRGGIPIPVMEQIKRLLLEFVSTSE